MPAFELLESKLHAPAARPGIVARDLLVNRLANGHTTPLICVVAPPGYGKSTLLAQWAARRQPRVGWVSLDDRDNDPAVLLTYVAEAVNRIESIGTGVFGTLASAAAAVAGPLHLLSAVAGLSAPIALVLDHLEAVTQPESLDAVAALALGLPTGSQLAIGSRRGPPLPTARLRAQGDIVEIGVDDLAMGGAEAGFLLDGAGVQLGEADVNELLRCTEGWPVGLYLAALAMTAGSPNAEIGLTFTGDDRFMSDYLRAEFLDRVLPAEASFLTATSILDSMSRTALRRHAGSNGIGSHARGARGPQPARDAARPPPRVVPLPPPVPRAAGDRAAAARTGNRHATPPRGPPRGARRTACPRRRSSTPRLPGDADRVCRLTLTNANRVWASGRATTVVRWMQWFEEHGLVERYPGIAVHGALMFALMGEPGDDRALGRRGRACADHGNARRRQHRRGHGRVPPRAARPRRRRGDAQRFADRLDRVEPDEPVPGDDAPHRGGLLPARRRPRPGRRDPRHGPRHRRSRRRDAVRAGAPRRRAALSPSTATTGGGPDRSPAQAESIMRDGRFDEYWTSALVYGWMARRRPARRRHRPRQGVRRSRSTASAPAQPRPPGGLCPGVARDGACISRSRRPGRRPRRAQTTRRHRPPAPSTRQPHAAGGRRRSQLATLREGALGASSLTTAELRLLPLLSTHLTLPEIGARLFISRHTVKTQAISVYRKLGVSSRSEAITRMRELGLLAHA